ncbi:MAG: hypothetical protein M3Z21_11990 [Pseudomonadota bacterium]|nr:hypothetical protein [Pseudomonadota bacterium]
MTMKTTYYAFSYDGGVHGNGRWTRTATISVTENSLGRRHVQVVGQRARQDYWRFFLESIEGGHIRPPNGLRELS